MQLKYLFTALYNDGTAFTQNAEDVSRQDPKRSAFFDVDQTKLLSFLLIPVDKVNDGVYCVDLRTGKFLVNGAEFFLHDRSVPLSNFRLIYVRRHREHIDINTETKKLSNKRADDVQYLLGFQANLPDGNNIQRIISII